MYACVYVSVSDAKISWWINIYFAAAVVASRQHVTYTSVGKALTVFMNFLSNISRDAKPSSVQLTPALLVLSGDLLDNSFAWKKGRTSSLITSASP